MSSLNAETAALSRMADRMAGARGRICKAARDAEDRGRALEFENWRYIDIDGPELFGDISDPRAFGRFTRTARGWYDHYRGRNISDEEYERLTGGD